MLSARQYGGYNPRASDSVFSVILIDDTPGSESQGDIISDLIAQVTPEHVNQRLKTYTVRDLKELTLKAGMVLEICSVSGGESQ